MKTKNNQVDVLDVAYRTQNAYSFPAYASWYRLTEYLMIARGFSPREAEAILRSKWTRWAGDASESRRYGKYTPADMERFLKNMTSDGSLQFDVDDLVNRTFTKSVEIVDADTTGDKTS